MITTMLDPEEARARVLQLLPDPVVEWAAVSDAIGRALSSDVVARRTLPPWDNSAMDGYAVRAEDTRSAPVTLQIVETIHAGQLPKRALGPGECARIMTGAPLPRGADAVVMQEQTRGPIDHRVELLEAANPRQFVRDRGEDAKQGEVLLPRGTPLGIPEAGLLWAQGIEQVQVPRPPTVAILSTGDELRAVSDPADGAGIVDTGSPSLEAAVERAGGRVTLLGIARDDPREVERKLEAALGHDLVLTIAGVSVGDRDPVKPALERLGVAVDFWKVAIKPGKPLVAGRRDRTVFVGLPGNPTSALVTFELFVRPALRRLLGHQEVAPPRCGGRVEGAMKKAPGLTHFVRVTTTFRDGDLWARPLTSQTSGALRSAASATHLLVFPHERAELEAGERVELLPLSWIA